MLKRMGYFFRLLFAFAILGFLGWGIIAFIRLYWRSVISLQPDLASAIIAASATVIVAVFTIVISKYYERKKEIEIQQRDKKIAIYEEFMEKWFDKLTEVSTNKNKQANLQDDKAFMKFLSEFTRKLILWGSDSVVKQYAYFRRESLQNQGDSPYAPLFNFEKILFEIRKDIGHSNQSLKQGDLLQLFINDMITVEEKTKGTKKS